MKIRKAVIPAAGLGSRMLPAAKTVPKEMFPVADRPVLHYIVEEAVAAGIEEIIILTNRSKTVMHDYFDYTPELEEKLRAAGKHAEVEALRAIADMADITFVRQKQTLGLGHAVWCTRRIVGDEPFAVLLGDDLMRSRTPVIGQLIDAAERYGAAAVGVQAVSKEDICKYCSPDVTHREGNVYMCTAWWKSPGRRKFYPISPFSAGMCLPRASLKSSKASPPATAARSS